MVTGWVSSAAAERAVRDVVTVLRARRAATARAVIADAVVAALDAATRDVVVGYAPAAAEMFERLNVRWEWQQSEPSVFGPGGRFRLLVDGVT